jgi:hypothetical protein
MTTETDIRKWMNDNVAKYASYAGDRWIVADMPMARDACQHFHGYDDKGNVPYFYFDIAYGVGNSYEILKNKK